MEYWETPEGRRHYDTIRKTAERQANAQEKIAEETRKLRVLKEYELGVVFREPSDAVAEDHLVTGRILGEGRPRFSVVWRSTNGGEV